MHKYFIFACASVLTALFLTPARTAESMVVPAVNGPETLMAAHYGISPEAGTLGLKRVSVLPPSGSHFGVRQTLNLRRPEIAGGIADTDGALAASSGTAMPAPSLSFDGLANLDNLAAYSLLILPPDMNGDVGPSHYVQAVNSLVRVYDKNGNAVTSPFKLSDLFAPLGTDCSMRNDGLPVVLYDPLADRWLISQYCSNYPPFRQMIAVSATSDPAGAYHLYEFVMPGVRLNDYAKFGVWTDAYYMSTDEFLGGDYVGAGMFAFDRAKLLKGDPTATYIYFSMPAAVTARIGGLLPSDMDGLMAPPAGAPNVFAGYTATEYGDAADAIRLFDFHADFTDPENSRFRERPESPLPVAAFDPTSPSGRADIMQPAPGEWLDSQSDRLMFRAAYRNFGTHDSIVLNQTVRVSPPGSAYRAGVRSYELRRSGSTFHVDHQATSGTAAASRWIGAAAQDHQGNIALGYNLVTDIKEPSIVYTGRLATDPAGTMRDETPLVTGTGVQKAFGWRWGDYSGMSVDPVDDCTFWMTNEYYTQESEDFSDYTWLTRIGRFKFDECAAAPRSLVRGLVTNAATGQPIAGAQVRAGNYWRSTGTDGRYGDAMVLPGSYRVTVSARGFNTAFADIQISAGQILTQDFALQPVAVPEIQSNTVTAESCAINGSPEPGELVTFAIALQNAGRASTQNLVAELVRSGGVTAPSGPQIYGALPTDGTPVSRPFSFRVSPNITCGNEVQITLKLSDGSTDLGTIVFDVRTGTPRIAMAESFDAVTAPALPAGWTSSATGSQMPWKTSAARRVSGNNSVFSPDPGQAGVNELVSPPIPITSTDAVLTFQNWYELETTFLRNRLYDGSVLEIKVGEGEWRDILEAGGSFVAGGYDDGLIDGCCQNPLAGRRGWSGKSGINAVPEFVQTTANLPAAAAGHDIRLRFRVGTDIGTFREGQYIDDLRVLDGYACSCTGVAVGRAPYDLDGDGTTDLSVFRGSDLPDQPDMIVENSSTGDVVETFWGSAGDKPAVADYDGDGRADHAVYRPSDGIWYILRSSDGTSTAVRFGLSNDVPVPGDLDGDLRADIVLYRRETGTWYILRSSDGQFAAHRFGVAEDVPMLADFDGDNKSDIAVYRPSTGTWYIAYSSGSSVRIDRFGTSGDIPVSADFDGDGKSDLAVFRPVTGEWYVARTKLGFGAVQFGLAGDRPLKADFDGDGSADIAVYRPSEGVWYYLKSSGGAAVVRQFGRTGDTAIPSAFSGN